MQLTQQVEVDVHVRLTYKGPTDVRMSIIAVAPYAQGGRSSTVTQDIKDDALQAQVVELCESIIEAHGAAVGRQAMQDAVQAEALAQRRGELSGAKPDEAPMPRQRQRPTVVKQEDE